MKVPFVSRKKYDEVVYKLECLLCHATGGRYSKATYSLNNMCRMVDEHIDRCIEDSDLERTWEINLETLKNGGFGDYTIAEECPKTMIRYWKAQAEAGYPSAIDSVRYFEDMARKESEDTE